MNRRSFFRLSAVAAGCAAVGPAVSGADTSGPESPRKYSVKPFQYDEATIADLQAAMQSGEETAVSLAKKYLKRIRDIDQDGPKVNSVIEINPDAISLARSLDQERRKRGPRGPLHGVPILLKDNIDTHDRMMTTAGSLALLGSIAARDSHVAHRLRKAGALILGKTNLSEWANFRGERSSSGWSGRGGQTNNPYVLNRNPSGSSSGSGAAVAANLCAAAVGTETDGSIISPSAVCGIVGIKPTVGLVSRSGIIPISHSQDTAGPMARTVRDAAILLSALAGRDPRDRATDSIKASENFDYTTSLDPKGLRGARIGVARRFFRNGVEKEVLETALAAMKSAGAILIDPLEFPGSNYGASEFEVMLYEFKHGLNAYLGALPPSAAVHSLADVIEFNRRHRDRELIHFGQENMIKAQEKGPLTDKAYLEALEKCRKGSRAEGIDAVMDKNQLDAIIGPSGGPSGITDWVYGDRSVGGSSSPAAVAGYPNITVPAGFVRDLPVGISFFGRAWSEPLLLKLAYAFEQETSIRKAPQFFASIS